MPERTALLVNPPIYDFAACDFWLKPLGLLRVGGMLRTAGFRVHLLDYLDRQHPLLPEGRHRRSDAFGRGRFFAEEVRPPRVLAGIQRKYKRYGLPGQPFQEVEATVRYVNSLGARVMLSEFSPVPGTPDGERARKFVALDDPLQENSTVFPLLYNGRNTVDRLKSLARELNRALL